MELAMTNNATQKPTWTVLVFMAADTGDSFYQAAMNDITEMTAAKFDDQVKVVVHADAPSPWDTKCWEIKAGVTMDPRKVLALDAESGKRGCGHTCLLDFVGMYLSDPNYKADNYLLVLWGHGEGIDWKEKVLGARTAQDIVAKRFAPGSGGVMEVGALGRSLRQLADVTGIQRDQLVVGFDACLMGMVEVYDEIHEYVGWAVATSDEIPQKGWPYQDILDRIGEISTPAGLAKEIVKTCADWYSLHIPESRVSFSACDLADSHGLSIATKELTQELRARIKEGSLRKAIREARDFAADLQESAYVDLYAFCSELKRKIVLQADKIGLKQLYEKADKVVEVLNQFVILHSFSDEYPYKYVMDSRGVAICFPESADLTGSLPGIEINWGSYKELRFSKDTKWPAFIQESFDRRSNN
jgi:Clostripain family